MISISMPIISAACRAIASTFLQYVLLKGYVKVRYFGVFASGYGKHLAALQTR